MLLQRVIVALLLAPLALYITYLGGVWYTFVITSILLVAAWECILLLKRANYGPAAPVIFLGVFALVMGERFPGIFPRSWIIVALIFVSAAYFALQYERSGQNVLGDFGSTLIATLYIGWLGSYLISIRFLSLGMWWMILVLLIVWTSDTAAYFMGTYLGRHKLSPRLSPNKTWEGYFAGVLFGILAGMGFPSLLGHLGSDLSLSLWQGALMGLIVSAAIPLGDLTESMFKRIAAVKDSGNLFPGHGGMFDRLDTLLWAMPLSTFFIQYILPLMRNL